MFLCYGEIANTARQYLAAKFLEVVPILNQLLECLCVQINNIRYAWFLQGAISVQIKL
jgi:hypothetical protein